jgi:hypothetical protein
VLHSLETGTGDENDLRDRMVAAVREVGDLTSQLVEIDEDHDQKALNDAAMECAGVLPPSALFFRKSTLTRHAHVSKGHEGAGHEGG